MERRVARSTFPFDLATKDNPLFSSLGSRILGALALVGIAAVPAFSDGSCTKFDYLFQADIKLDAISGPFVVISLDVENLLTNCSGSTVQLRWGPDDTPTFLSACGRSHFVFPTVGNTWLDAAASDASCSSLADYLTL